MKRIKYLLLGLISLVSLIYLSNCDLEGFNFDISNVETILDAHNIETDGFRIIIPIISRDQEWVNRIDIDTNIDILNQIVTITLKFNENYSYPDGIKRGGQIIFTVPVSWLDDSISYVNFIGNIKVQFDNFKYGNLLANGIINLEFLDSVSINYLGNLYISKQLSLQIEDTFYINYSSSEITKYTGMSQVNYLTGYNTPDFNDDLIMYNSQYSGTNQNGLGFTFSGDNLVLKQCSNEPQIVYGSATLTLSDGTETILDFGDSGECDDTYSLTQNNQTIILTYREGD